ncbi:MAG: class I SAM-dependent methyltransferase [Pseudomonadota bacterium]
MPAHIEAQTDYASIKVKQNAAWSSGNYAVIGTTLQKVGEDLADRMDLRPPSSILDVAAGNGNATLAFARRWHKVVSTDYVEALLRKGQARAAAEGLDIRFQVADAEQLPFADNSFDAVVSTFGVMFAPNQFAAADELLRVCRPGGKVGLANWTPDGFVGRLFRTLGGFVSPPAGVKSPAVWGDEAWLNATFGGASCILVQPRVFTFRYCSPEHFVETFRDLYGPVHKTFQALTDDRRNDLSDAITSLIAEFNTAKDGSVHVPGAYSEVVICN